MPTVLITGANRGIGLALAQEFHVRGWSVLGTARQVGSCQELKQLAQQVLPLDVSSDSSIKQLAHQLQGVPIDVLINNAGVYHKGELNSDNMVDEYRTNSLGPILMSYALLPNLRQSKTPRIINMSSRMGSIADNTSGGSYGYRASKAALNAMVKSWSHDVQDVPAIITHPGYIQTGMTGGQGEMDTTECARRLMANIIEEFVGIKPENRWKSGAFVHRDGFELPW